MTPSVEGGIPPIMLSGIGRLGGIPPLGRGLGGIPPLDRVWFPPPFLRRLAL